MDPFQLAKHKNDYSRLGVDLPVGAVCEYRAQSSDINCEMPPSSIEELADRWEKVRAAWQGGLAYNFTIVGRIRGVSPSP
jgi:hypothetical protein